MSEKHIRILFSALFSLAFFINSACFAADAGTVRRHVEKPVRDAIEIRQHTQKARKKWLEERQRLLEELKRLQTENEQLGTLRHQLEEKISSSRKRIAAKEEELRGIGQISKDIMPFLRETLAWLEKETQDGLPFLMEERQRRIGRLRNLMDDPEVPASEKFRKIMEAMLIEAEYGTTVEVTSESITLSGEPVLVNILRLGRLNLFYQTLDGNSCGFFNAAQDRWQELPRKYNRDITLAMDMARKRRPVEVVALPVGRIQGR